MTNIYFDEIKHKYTDDENTSYTSVTTIIAKFTNEFNSTKLSIQCEKIGKTPGHPKYEKYKDKSAEQLVEEWNLNRDQACEKGTRKHLFIETALLDCTTNEKFQNNKMFTIENITPELGILNIDKFRTQVGEKYPEIFRVIEILHKNGFRFFPELVVFNKDMGVSGTIDLFVVRNDKFLIIDWKTNRDYIMFDSGYYEKDRDGNRTGKFVVDNKRMKSPLDRLADSTGNHYTLQISGYAWLAEKFGYKNIDQNMIFQIRDIDNKEKVDKYDLKDMKRMSEVMFKHN